MVLKLVCNKCGKRYSKIEFNGDLFAEELEDIYFIAKIVKDELVIEPAKDDKEYFEDTFNSERWLSFLKREVENGELFCDRCDGFVVPEPTNLKYRCPKCGSHNVYAWIRSATVIIQVDEYGNYISEENDEEQTLVSARCNDCGYESNASWEWEV